MRSIDKAKWKPVDSVAAKVTSRGTEYEFTTRGKPTKNESDTPFAIGIRYKGSIPILKLKGVRIGMLTVLGPSLERRKMVVCRCDCSKYVVRKLRMLKQVMVKTDRYSYKTDRCSRCARYHVHGMILRGEMKERNP